VSIIQIVQLSIKHIIYNARVMYVDDETQQELIDNGDYHIVYNIGRHN
jgi:hypothetical protein